MKTSTNGVRHSHDIQQFQLVDSSEPIFVKEKSTKESKNPVINCELVLDAGSKRIKSYLNGSTTTLDSVFKEIKGDLPIGMSGCFRYKNKNYVVGRGCDAMLGELVAAHTDNKIKKLDIWLLGALASDVDFLDDLIADKKNRYKQKPIRLIIDLKLLSLSSNRIGDISKILKSIGSFEYQGREFTVGFKNLNNDYIFSEGYGAALSAVQMINKEIDSFAIIDLGGGTLTLTSYAIGKKYPFPDVNPIPDIETVSSD